MTSVNTGNPSTVGIQSVEVAAPLLRALVDLGEGALSSLAAAANMPPSKARKYLASLVRTQLVAQDGAGGKYKLGPFALELGLASMRQLDVVEMAQETLNDLRDELNTTASMAIWTESGPAIVRWAQTSYMAHPMRLGTVLPLLTSAPGRIFAAYLDEARTQKLLSRELKEATDAARTAGFRTLADVKRMTAEVRDAGLCTINSVVAPGVDVVCAPVFDHMGGIVAAIAAVGLHGQGFDRSATGRFARSLVVACHALSRRLGSSASLPPGSGSRAAQRP
jgi:DNA-binding IclR family transcriptional regulator